MRLTTERILPLDHESFQRQLFFSTSRSYDGS
jgi:hypothetical protein